MAVNGSFSPLGRLEEWAGVTAIDTKEGILTVSTVVPVMPPNVALIEAAPTANPVATPAAEIVATAGVADTQATWLVRSLVECR